ncbi:MAG: TIGR04282 family arsenosugar biosynthesis glycosyltransferase [Cyclobacteriaceae bacterium]
MSKDLLIVFVKNLIPGSVKRRLAEDIGMDLAMEVYKELVAATAEVTDKVKMDRAIYYSEYVELYDFFDDTKYQKHIQEGKDLGQRMLNAIFDGIENEYDKVVLIGTDIPELTPKLINIAFETLNKHDVVVGPANDGGYYLVGMKDAHNNLFEGKEYSHDKVHEELVEEAEDAGLSIGLLPTLTDIDTKEDMKAVGIEIVYEDEDDSESLD